MAKISLTLRDKATVLLFLDGKPKSLGNKTDLGLHIEPRPGDSTAWLLVNTHEHKKKIPQEVIAKRQGTTRSTFNEIAKLTPYGKEVDKFVTKLAVPLSVTITKVPIVTV